jgi:hypothetical protein
LLYVHSSTKPELAIHAYTPLKNGNSECGGLVEQSCQVQTEGLSSATTNPTLIDLRLTSGLCGEIPAYNATAVARSR